MAMGVFEPGDIATVEIRHERIKLRQVTNAYIARSFTKPHSERRHTLCQYGDLYPTGNG